MTQAFDGFREPAQPLPPPMVKRATEQCPNCRGHGHILDINGEPAHCRECDGSGLVRARDSRGRFVANQNDAEDFTAADFMAGAVEYEARTAIRSLVALYGKAAERLVKIYLKDELERKRT